ncbi:MAG: hypothetical protein HQL75_03490 [Magnetococcales bacterium]|nr:hypothetical protein [Magnetococcales bacterium]
MSLSEKRLQQRRNKKNAKKQSRKKNTIGTLIGSYGNIHAAINAPVHECLVSETLEDDGIGNVFFSRKMLNGDIALGSFLIDIYCLGVKDSFFRIISEHEYQHFIGNSPQKMETIHPACARKLIEGSVEFAHQYGIAPHKEYKTVMLIFGDFDSDVCPSSYEYGKDGEPLFIPGPYDSQKKIKEIFEKIGYDDLSVLRGVSGELSPEDLEGLGPDYEYVNFEITEDALPDKKLDQLTAAERDELDAIHDQLTLGSHKVIRRLQEFIQKYPDIPVLYNYLFVSYSCSNNTEKTIETLAKCMELFPDYLFSKIAHCHQKMNEGDMEIVPKVFDGRFDLSFHIKDRRTYHISEFTGFNALMVRYFKMIGKERIAKNFLELLERVAPDHPTTQSAKRFLNPGLLHKFINKMRNV